MLGGGGCLVCFGFFSFINSVLILSPLALTVGIFASDKYEYCPMSVLAIIRVDSLVDGEQLKGS